MQNTLMKAAISQAKLAKRRGNLPFSAVVVRDGQVIAKGFSKEMELHDVTAHAETSAISKACRVLKTEELKDCEIYASGEPCAMCASAIFHAKIPRVYVAALRSDLPQVFRRRKIDNFALADDLSYQPVVKTGLMKDQSIKLFEDIKL